MLAAVGVQASDEPVAGSRPAASADQATATRVDLPPLAAPHTWPEPVRVASSAVDAGTGGGRVVMSRELLAAYEQAVDTAPSSCGLTVAVLAAIGQVESGSLAGRRLDPQHRARPPVFGPVLDGDDFAAVPDTDGGRLDGHSRWDRAVGPMQFLPMTWEAFGRDGDGDGAKDPQDIDDAATSAAAYLCSSGVDLGTQEGLRAAVLSYNPSQAYYFLVVRWVTAFEAAVGPLAMVPQLPWPTAVTATSTDVVSRAPGRTRTRTAALRGTGGTGGPGGDRGSDGGPRGTAGPTSTAPSMSGPSPASPVFSPGRPAGGRCEVEEPGAPRPSELPTELPAELPTDLPTDVPTDAPTELPTELPTDVPTDAPSDLPTGPTASPSVPAPEEPTTPPCAPARP